MMRKYWYKNLYTSILFDKLFQCNPVQSLVQYINMFFKIHLLFYAHFCNSSSANNSSSINSKTLTTMLLPA